MMKTKMRMLGLAVILGLVAPHARAQTCTPAPAGLVSWYSMEGSPNDRVGANNPSGTSALSYVAGEVGQGVTLGSGGFIDIPDSPGLQLQRITLDAWVRPDGPGPNDDSAGSCIITKNIDSNNVAVQINWTTQNGGRFLLNFYGGQISSADAFPAGAFYHVAGTYDGTTFRLYVNGALEGSEAVTQTISYTSVPWVIGANNPAARGIGYPRTWNGVIDEVEIIARALSATEVADLYAAGSAGKCFGQACTPAPSAMVSWYRMEGSADDALGANDPSATSAISFVAGEVGQGVTFGSGGFIDVPDSPSLRPQQVTVDAWVRPDGPGPNNDGLGSVIVEKAADNTGVNMSYLLTWRATDNRFLFTVRDESTQLVTSANSFPAGAFYHVAGTYDGATVKLYVNGALEGSLSLGTTIAYSNVPLAIGANPALFRSGFPRTWNGVIDEVEIIGRPLSASEVADLFVAGSAGKCRCGNGVVDPGEQCDDGNTINGDGCDNNCTFTACGNGIVTSGEQCDDGNTVNGDCCSATCQFEGSGNPCPDDGNPCTTDSCDGAGSCVHSAGNPGAVCRPAAGDCDVDDTCDGTSTACPPDAFQPSTHECRASAGVCDIAENCSGTGPNCPADAKSTALCRPAVADCDTPESCDGVSNNCPPDGFQPATFECRAAAGPCDAAEFCTGTGVNCPADAKSTGVCRPAASACDVAETCDGSSNDCPPDGFGPDGMTCSDGNFCTSGDHCMSGSCVGTAVTDGTPCNDGNSCSSGDQCTGGICVASQRPNGSPCDDGNPCTINDQCNAGSCVGSPAPTNTPCSDGNPCTTGDHCSGGSCIGAPVANGTPCGTGNTCKTVGICTAGACHETARPNGAPCDDGNQCTSGDQCAGGVCVGVPRADGGSCTDGNSCTTDDRCNAGVCRGVPRPDGSQCGGGTACTTAEQCEGGSCVGTPGPDGTPCDDGNPCTGTDICQAGRCAGTPVSDGTSCLDANTCMAGGQCTAGACHGTPRPNGASCDDANLCTSGDHCDVGVCVGAAVPDGAVCNDDNSCTNGDHCVAGFCAGTPRSDGARCNDDNPCTRPDECAGGSCVGSPIPDGTACDDGNDCTGNDQCFEGHCAGAPLSNGTACADPNPCARGGQCIGGHCGAALRADGAACNDKNPCTTNDQCTGGRCAGAAVPNGAVCDDELSCTGGDRCTNGACVGVALSDGTGCDDANTCTSGDACNGGRCIGAPDVEGSACADGNACTDGDHCVSGFCAGAPVADGTACSDGSTCTSGDACRGGRCAGFPVADGTSCGEGCTSGQCDGGTCEGPAASDGTSCNDGNDCTVSDQCTGGVCAGAPTTCTVSAGIDHYLCYKAKLTSPLLGHAVFLQDAFGSAQGTTTKPKDICAPADKNGEGIHDATTHEEAYSLKLTFAQGPVPNLTVVDQFGTLHVNTVKPDRLLVPTNKVVGSPPPPPPPAPEPGVADHYECYKMKITPGTTGFPKGIQVTAADQFQTRVYDVKKPKLLCTPVDKNGEGIVRPLANLMCYQVKTAKTQPKTIPVVGQIVTTNQFLTEALDLLKEDVLCVPATRTP